MAADVFSRGGNTLAGVFSADGSRMTFSGGDSDGATGLITQQLNVSYSSMVTRIWEIGTNNTYLIAGRTSGQGNIQDVVGPKKLAVAFYKRYGNVCNAPKNIINLAASANCVSGDVPAGAATGGEFRIIIRNVYITQMSIGTEAQQMVINHALQIGFIALELAS